MKTNIKGKKALYFSEAEHLYVAELKTLEDISKVIPVSTRTLQDWKDEGRWEEKRADLMKSKNTFRTEFITFAELLIERVNRKLAKGEDVSASELFTVAKLAQEVLKEEVKKEGTQQEKPEKATVSVEDAMAAVERYLKGEL